MFRVMVAKEEPASACVAVAERRESEPAAVNGKLCGVMLLCGGAYPLVPDAGLPENREMWSADEMEEHIRSQLAPDGACICVHGRNLRERVVVFSACDRREVRTVAQDFYSWIAGRGEIAVTVAIWSEPVPLPEVGEIFAKLRGRVYKQILFFRSQLLTDDRVPDRVFQAGEHPAELVRALETRDPDRINRATSALLGACLQQSARQAELVLCLEKILLRFFDGELSMSRMEELRFEVHGAISAALRPSELSEELSQIFYTWTAADNRLETDELQALCEEVAAYLQLHYRENIRGGDLARRFGMSATQLAAHFKAHFHVSLSEYINRHRIETAQAILRSDPGRMVKEVALAVGYNDQYYFSNLFKQVTGIWPTEYLRERHGNRVGSRL